MKKPILIVAVLMVVVISLPFLLKIASKQGKGPDTVQSRSAPVQSGPASAIVAEEAIALWVQGLPDEALSLLLEDERSSQASATRLECLSLTEAQFVQLPEEERSRMAAQLQVAGKAAKDLYRAAVARIKTSYAEGEREEAERWASRVKGFGTQLAGPDYCVILQLTGRAIEEAVARDVP
jgi:hypothetical protein